VGSVASPIVGEGFARRRRRCRDETPDAIALRVASEQQRIARDRAQREHVPVLERHPLARQRIDVRRVDRGQVDQVEVVGEDDEHVGRTLLRRVDLDRGIVDRRPVRALERGLERDQREDEEQLGGSHDPAIFAGRTVRELASISGNPALFPKPGRARGPAYRQTKRSQPRGWRALTAANHRQATYRIAMTIAKTR
jgi:hypothetical protein